MQIHGQEMDWIRTFIISLALSILMGAVLIYTVLQDDRKNKKNANKEYAKIDTIATVVLAFFIVFFVISILIGTTIAIGIERHMYLLASLAFITGIVIVASLIFYAFYAFFKGKRANNTKGG